jgi:hypothetical protein
MAHRRNVDTVEERNFQASLVILELHFERPASYMANSMVEVKKMVAGTLDKSLNQATVRYVAVSDSIDKGTRLTSSAEKTSPKMSPSGCVFREYSTAPYPSSKAGLSASPVTRLGCLQATMFPNLPS